MLFLFDADTDHGRFLRLDTIPAPQNGNRKITVRLPLENTINKTNLARLVEELQHSASRE